MEEMDDFGSTLDDPGPTIGSSSGVTEQPDNPDGRARSQPSDNRQQSESGRGSEATMASVPSVQLPQNFVVKYLGKRDAPGLWGIKHTRKPVDEMVAAARGLKPGATLPFLQLKVSSKGMDISAMPQNNNPNFEGGLHGIDTISYGVQDLVYTRVFAVIMVKEASNLLDQHPFQCHAFVCDSRHSARSLTFALAAAFQEFSRAVKGNEVKKPKKFAIDLRSPEEIQADVGEAQEPDSEA